MMQFVECATCAAKPGSPPLCGSCYHNRTVIDRLDSIVENYHKHPFRTWLAYRITQTRRQLEAAAWPTFDCEDCIGMVQHGCYCSASDAVAPGCPPERKHLVLRRIHRFFWPRSKYHK